MKTWLVLAVSLAGCSGGGTGSEPTARPTNSLEAAAIDAGMIADPASVDITGFYTRDTDRICVVPAPQDYKIGILVNYGDDLGCSGSGTAKRTGGKLDVLFPAAPGCGFEARFEGDRLIFPAKVPAACAKLCQGRASIAALDVERISDSTSEASSLRSRSGQFAVRRLTFT
ncbi:hypothetical protein H5J25_09845 [Sphingomonas aliaeris]|uniref:Uncharacterized protein n=1 Tax=Sphingomonas aliaeris TaxID=2759526 RepID=A0A974S2T2_9SPHN|nr:hypothetical protein [Sphingomonas aliaeris]QQV75909.1 hypothetical protein H5J25_09845 [Sphingomonas aliaeris]